MLFRSRYLGLVYHVAREVGIRTPAVEVGELVSAGTLGLIRALDSFDLSRGLAFSTYAVRRIRGAMLDDLRSRDWTPRSTRIKSRQLAGTVAELQARLGREPRSREVAEALGVSLEGYWDWRRGAERGVMVSFDAPPAGAEQGAVLEETIENPDAPLPDHAMMTEERTDGVKAAIARLPEKERTVLALYYYEELNLRQIAEVLHVTESRVSQIRSQALRRLRDRLGSRERL